MRRKYSEASATYRGGKRKICWSRMKEGDEAAKEEYIKGNLRLVLSVIKRFSGKQ